MSFSRGQPDYYPIGTPDPGSAEMRGGQSGKPWKRSALIIPLWISTLTGVELWWFIRFLFSELCGKTIPEYRGKLYPFLGKFSLQQPPIFQKRKRKSGFVFKILTGNCF